MKTPALKVGSKVYKLPGHTLYHVRAIVDDEWVVMRCWRGRGYGWDYRIEHIDAMPGGKYKLYVW